LGTSTVAEDETGPKVTSGGCGGASTGASTGASAGT
jgi:hypothetical protein